MKFFSLCLSLLLCLLLCSCRTEAIGADAMLAALMEEAAPLPSGTVYRTSSEEGSEGYASPSLLRSLYGESAEDVFSVVAEYALYLSERSFPAEIAVFRCHSASDTDTVLSLCFNRRDILQAFLRGTAFEKKLSSIFIVSQGRVVIMGFAENNEALQKEALRLIR